MTTDTTANLGLPYLIAAQAQKHVTHNEALRALDAVVQLSVNDRNLTTPPASPADGDRYIVAASAAGDWAGKAGQIAAWQDNAWLFYIPQEGWLCWVADEYTLLVWDGSAWNAVSTGGTGASATLNPVTGGLVGINATADTTNRLTVKTDAVLFSHDDVTPGSGDMHAKLNKAVAANTATLLFQDDYSGRAEIGLAGDDDFHLKVSADGSAWQEAMKIGASDVRITFGGFVHAPGLSVGTSAESVNNASTMTPVALMSATGVSAGMQFCRHTSPGGGGPQYILASTRGGDANEYTALQAGDGIGTFQFSGSDGTRYQPGAAVRGTATQNASTDSLRASLSFQVSQGTAANAMADVARFNPDLSSEFFGVPRPTSDNAISLGSASYRWSTVYAATGSINTSDAREKIVLNPSEGSIGDLAGAMIDAVEPVLFRWRSGGAELVADGFDIDEDGQKTSRFREVERAGERIHAGFIAQDIKAVLDAKGLDCGMWCLDDKHDPDSRQGLRTDQLIALLWAALQETRAELNALRLNTTLQSDT